MPALGPGIGKQQVKSFDGFFRQQITHSIGNFDTQNANIFELACFANRFRDTTSHFVDPEEIFFGKTPGQFTQQ